MVLKLGLSTFRPQCTISFTQAAGEQTHKEAGVASDGEFWTSKTLSTIALLDKDAKHVKPLIDIHEDVQTLLAKTEKIIGQLRKVQYPSAFGFS